MSMSIVEVIVIKKCNNNNRDQAKSDTGVYFYGFGTEVRSEGCSLILLLQTYFQWQIIMILFILACNLIYCRRVCQRRT